MGSFSVRANYTVISVFNMLFYMELVTVLVWMSTSPDTPVIKGFMEKYCKGSQYANSHNKSLKNQRWKAGYLVHHFANVCWIHVSGSFGALFWSGKEFKTRWFYVFLFCYLEHWKHLQVTLSVRGNYVTSVYLPVPLVWSMATGHWHP